MLHNLFMTRVKLEAPASGPAASAHNQQLAEDAEELLAEQNLSHLSSLCPNMCGPVPTCPHLSVVELGLTWLTEAACSIAFHEKGSCRFTHSIAHRC